MENYILYLNLKIIHLQSVEIKGIIENQPNPHSLEYLDLILSRDVLLTYSWDEKFGKQGLKNFYVFNTLLPCMFRDLIQL